MTEPRERVAPPLAGHVARSMLGTVAFRLSGALGGVLAARLLEPSGRGRYGLLVVVATALGTAALAGLPFWVARQAGGRRAGEVAPVIGRHLRATSAVLGGLLAAALLAGRVVALGSAAELAAAALLAFAVAWSTLELAVPNGLLRMGAVALITTANGMTFLLWMAVGLAAGARSPAFAVLGAAVANLTMVPLARRHRRALPADAPGRGPVRAAHRRAVRFGLPLGAGELVTLASFRLDLVLVAAFVAPREVGLYAVAVALSELLLVVPDAVALVLLPHACRHSGRTGTARLVAAASAATAVAGAGLLWVAGPVVTTVFGAAYSEAAEVLPALLVGTVARGAWKMIGAGAVARGDRRSRPASALVGLVAMVAADLFLVPAYGIAGAAAGSAIGSVIATAHLARGAGRSARPAAEQPPRPAPAPTPLAA